MSIRLPTRLLAALAFCAVASAQEPATPAPVIPAPRAEPVVPASPAKSVATQLNDALVSVFEHVAPTVVVIDVLKKLSPDGDGSDNFPDFFFHSPGGGNNGGGHGGSPDGAPADEARPTPSEGSGFIIQAGGYILTNHHVVGGAEKITVRLKDGREFPGKIVGDDEKTDIAVVKIEATDLPVAELADSDAVRVGQIACAIGVPYNLDYSFTMGVVSAKGRNKLAIGPQDNYEDYLQTDASINPGNSGGPLVDLDGKVIGMNTLINGFNRGLGFAIPSNMLRETGDQLIRSGRVIRPYIGVRILSIGDDTAERFGAIFKGLKKGVIVETILPDTPAYHSDLHTADVITEVDGVAVNTDRELQKQILSKKVGATVQLTVIRKDKSMKVPVTTGELPSAVARQGPDNAEENPGGGDAEPPKPEAGQFYGMQLQDLTKDLASSLGLNASAGVVVTAVGDDTPASRGGMSVRDVITAVGESPVKDIASFKEAVKGADPKRGILCYVERGGSKTFVVIKGE
jgi:Do/DeqQ family serine protease